MLLEADWVVPVSGPPLADGAVLVVDGMIKAVAPAAQLRAAYPAESVRAFPGCVLLPGLVNVHTHLDFSAFRAFTRPGGFSEWMLRLITARRKLDSDDWAASALWGAYECARSGVTSIGDTSAEGWTVARAARAAGLRARVYLEVFGLDDAELPVTMERMEARLERLQRECDSGSGGPVSGDGGSAVEVGLSPHAPYTVSARLYHEAARFARRAGLRVATHVAESQAEVELLVYGKGAIAHVYKAANLWTGQRWTPPHMRPVQHLAKAGALGPETLVIHAVQTDADDVATLAGSGAAVAHCPRSNLLLRCGVAPVAEMIGAGVTVGLGTDSLASNDSLDMFAEMRAALAAGKERAAALGLAAALDPATVLRLATLDGARALGWDDLIGSLEPGKRADVIAVSLAGAAGADAARAGAASVDPQPHTFSPDAPTGLDPVELLVEAATADDVQMTMVAGTVVFERGVVPPDVSRGLIIVRAKLGLVG